MIAVDTSAVIAVALRESGWDRCRGVLRSNDLIMSAANLAEALVVAHRRGVPAEVQSLVDGLAIEIAAVTAGDAIRVAAAHARWGKGVHPAGLNYGDCFAYALATGLDVPLLFVGDDFARTDVRRALPPAAED